MLAQAEEFDILHQHHLVELHREQGAVDDFFHAFVVAASQIADGFLITLRRSGQPSREGSSPRSSSTPFMRAAIPAVCEEITVTMAFCLIWF